MAKIWQLFANGFRKLLFDTNCYPDVTQKPTHEVLGKVLTDSLPPYMIPEYIVILPSVAFNHNGKVDVTSLPYPTESDKWHKSTDYVVPTNQLEQHICAAFSQVVRNYVVALIIAVFVWHCGSVLLFV